MTSTYDKEFVEEFGSFEKFAAVDGAYKIYEVDIDYYGGIKKKYLAVYSPQDELNMINSPEILNHVLVWEKK